MILEGKTLKTL